MKSREQNSTKCNCILTYSVNGKYTNFYIELPTDEGSISVMVNPYMKNKESLAKLVYKIRKSLEEGN